MLPEELYQIVWQKIEETIEEVKWARVIMKLGEVLEEEFLDWYVKTGK